MSLETQMAKSLGKSFFRFNYDSGRILNVTTGKLMPRVRCGAIRAPESPPQPSRTPVADLVAEEQQSGDLKLYPFGEIIEAVCTVCGTTQAEVLGVCRDKRIAMARNIAFYLLRQHTAMSLPNIAKKMDRECYSTAVHGWKKVRDHPANFSEKIAKIMVHLSENQTNQTTLKSKNRKPVL